MIVNMSFSETLSDGPLRVEGFMHENLKCPIMLLGHEHKMLFTCGCEFKINKINCFNNMLRLLRLLMNWSQLMCKMK
jgi:hypothetical protein